MKFRPLLFLLPLLFLTAALRADQIDPFSDPNTIDHGSDGTALINAFISTTSANAINGVQLNYDLSNGAFVFMDKKYQGVNATTGDSFRFYYNGTGASNNIEFKLTDSKGNIWWKQFPNFSNTGGAWIPLVVPFSSLVQWTPSTLPLDYTDLSKIEIAVSKGSAATSGGKGTIAFDQLELYQQNSPVSILDNDCNSYTNALGNQMFFWSPMVADTANTPLANSGDNKFHLLVVQSTVPTPSPKGDNYYAMSYSFLTPTGTVVLSNLLRTYSGGVVVSSLDVTSANYITFYMRGDAGGERPRLGIDWWDGTASSSIGRGEVNLWTIKPLTTDWQLYSIPLTSFGPIYKKWVVEQKIEFNRDDVLPSGSGTIYMDEIRFTQKPQYDAGVGTVGTIDPMEDVTSANSAWSFSVNDDGSATHPLVDVSYANVAGFSNHAVQATYDFAKGGSWFTMYRSTGKNILSSSGLRFKFAGTDTSSDLEFEITDMNKVTYFRKYYGVTNTNGQWKTVTIPFKELAPFVSGSTVPLNLKAIKTFTFAVNKRGSGGAGTLCVSDLETVNDADYQLNSSGFNMLTSFKVPDNPFSPNGDGVKDTARFVYNLKDSANVKLEVFGMNGSKVYNTELDDTYDGSEHTLVWTGVDNNGARVNNGLYFYKFTVKGLSGPEDDIKHVIGVIR